MSTALLSSLQQHLHQEISEAEYSEKAAQLSLLGQQLHMAEQPEAALAAFEQAALLTPNELSIWHALATLRLQLKLPQAALEACNRALEIDRLLPDTLFNTAVVLAELNQLEAAMHCYSKVLEQQPHHYGALRNVPMIWARCKKDAEARHAARLAITIYPQDPWLHFNEGELLLGMYAAADAAVSYRQALTLDPELHRARYALSIALAMQGRISEAYLERDAALMAEPALILSYQSPLTLDAMAGTNDVSPERVAVIAMFDILLRNDWRQYEQNYKLYAELVKGEHGAPPLSQHEMPHLALVLPITESLRQQVARQAAEQVSLRVQGSHIHRPQRHSSQQIRIGYLSANFRPHPNARLMGNLYSRHDRSHFKVHAYSVGPVANCFERDRVQAGVDVFRDLENMPAQAAAQSIVNDGIDILIDLSGFARHARPEILALRPAALQLSYLGFQGTLGAPYIDYALLDRNILLPEIRQFWDEKIAYLPDCSYHCERPVITAEASRTEEGLPEHGFVLGALHHPRKIEPDSFRVWISLLQELPEAVLWLQYETQEQLENLKRFAAAHGVLEQRLVFSPHAGYEKHLARLRLADVYLDTFTYNGHTTTVESLGMGVPVVTLQGQGVVARIASSMLKAHGLPELAASTVDEYKSIVHKLARDTAWRNEIGRRVSDYAKSNLFCPERRVREIETAYRMMWTRHQAGLPPEDFDVPSAIA